MLSVLISYNFFELTIMNSQVRALQSIYKMLVKISLSQVTDLKCFQAQRGRWNNLVTAIFAEQMLQSSCPIKQMVKWIAALGLVEPSPATEKRRGYSVINKHHANMSRRGKKRGCTYYHRVYLQIACPHFLYYQTWWLFFHLAGRWKHSMLYCPLQWCVHYDPQKHL